MGDEKPTVVEALAAVMAEVQTVRKNQRNTEQGYNFRGIDAVVNAVGPVLRKHGVVVLPMLESAAYRDVTTSRGKPSRESTVQVRYRFYGPRGDYADAVVPGEAMDFGDKGVAKAMSVAYRIVLLQTLCIPTDEPDADSQTYERGQPTQRPAVVPEWDDAEQEALYAGWSADIAKATPDDLAAISQTLFEMHRREELSRDVYERLKTQGKQRKIELGGSMTEKTRARVFVLLGELGLAADDHQETRRGLASELLGRTVTSMRTLTEVEGQRLVTALTQRKKETVKT